MSYTSAYMDMVKEKAEFGERFLSVAKIRTCHKGPLAWGPHQGKGLPEGGQALGELQSENVVAHGLERDTSRPTQALGIGARARRGGPKATLQVGHRRRSGTHPFQSGETVPRVLREGAQERNLVQGCTVHEGVLYHPPKCFFMSPIKPSVYVVLTRVMTKMTNCNFAERVGTVAFYDPRLVAYRKRVEMSYSP
ncbi:hypothetical protein KUCAC02_007729 [Chaenocephalus aceratus]|uniref:Uncharacterized protein n=1 Tax=Chaenocephalus aceratus TaxID=36190 RepID=A0ACB9X6K8_CHAAC|nr:hypothetical protein KUCAC02_007729 [Chaenocephalus aceratus]